MFARILCGLAAVTLAAQDDPRDLLLRVRDRIMESVDRLPKYLCTQTIDRVEYKPDDGVSLTSCDKLLGKRKNPKWKLHIDSSDRLRLDVAIFASNEIYSWKGEDRFPDKELHDLVPAGALSSGSFGSFLLMIFRTDEASFSYNGEITENGRTLVEFGFRTPKENSHYNYRSGIRSFVTGYDGSFLVDPKTLDLVRLSVRTDELPSESGACEATSTMEYGRVRLNGAEFLLPSETRLRIILPDGIEDENRSAYTGCREFGDESSVKFGETSIESQPASPQETRTLPPSLSFDAAFTQDIDTASAAAGDTITGELTTPIRDLQGKVLAPKGTKVVGRIFWLHRDYHPAKWTMLARLERMELDGVMQPVSIVASVTAKKSYPIAHPEEFSTLYTIPHHGLGTFEFRDAGANFVIKKGIKSTWVTGEPLP